MRPGSGLMEAEEMEQEEDVHFRRIVVRTDLFTFVRVISVRMAISAKKTKKWHIYLLFLKDIAIDFVGYIPGGLSKGLGKTFGPKNEYLEVSNRE